MKRRLPLPTRRSSSMRTRRSRMTSSAVPMPSWVRRKKRSSRSSVRCVSLAVCRSLRAIAVMLTRAPAHGHKPSRSWRFASAAFALYVSPIDMALVCVGLADAKGAMAALEEAYRDRAARMVTVGDPFFSELRLDTRYRELLSRLVCPRSRRCLRTVPRPASIGRSCASRLRSGPAWPWCVKTTPSHRRVMPPH